MSKLEHGTTNEVFWNNVEREMRRGASRVDAVRTAKRALIDACDKAGVPVPEMDRSDAIALLPLPDVELALDDSNFNRRTEEFIRSVLKR